LSWLGNGFQTVALAVAVVTTGGGPGELGLVLASSVLAMLVCALFGGVWADRVQPQPVMIGSDAVRCVAVAAMAVMFTAHYRSLPLLCALAALSAGAGAFFSPAMTALKPMLVPVGARQSANASLGMLQTISSVLGPALGGVTVAALGAPTGFVVNAASFVASMVTVSLIRAKADRPPRTGIWHELGEGWREIRRRDWLLSGVLSATAYHVANGVLIVLSQVVAIRELGGANAVGLIAAAQGLGGVIGAAIAIRYRPARLLRAGWLALGLMPLWALAYVWPATLTAVVAGAVLGYAGLSFFSVGWETAIQDHVPHQVLARVASWDTLTSFLGMPIGSALAGPLSQALGFTPVFLTCGAVMLASGMAPLLAPGSRHLSRPAPTIPAATPIGVPADSLVT
jgi:MFS family permease